MSIYDILLNYTEISWLPKNNHVECDWILNILLLLLFLKRKQSPFEEQYDREKPIQVFFGKLLRWIFKCC